MKYFYYVAQQNSNFYHGCISTSGEFPLVFLTKDIKTKFKLSTSPMIINYFEVTKSEHDKYLELVE